VTDRVLTPRVSNERIAMLVEAGETLRIVGPGAWDGMEAQHLLLDLRDERAASERLRAERDLLRAAAHEAFKMLDGTPTDDAIASARRILSNAGWDTLEATR